MEAAHSSKEQAEEEAQRQQAEQVDHPSADEEQARHLRQQLQQRTQQAEAEDENRETVERLARRALFTFDGRSDVAHFAKINNENQVTQIIVVANEDCQNLDFPQSEPIGQAFIASLGLEGTWKQTSYNSNFRGRYASGCEYDAAIDEFVAPEVEAN